MKILKWEEMSDGSWFLADMEIDYYPGVVHEVHRHHAGRGEGPVIANYREWNASMSSNLRISCASLEEGIIQIQRWATLAGHRIEEPHWGGVSP